MRSGSHRTLNLFEDSSERASARSFLSAEVPIELNLSEDSSERASARSFLCAQVSVEPNLSEDSCEHEIFPMHSGFRRTAQHAECHIYLVRA